MGQNRSFVNYPFLLADIKADINIMGDFGDVSDLPNLSELEVARMIQKAGHDGFSDYILDSGSGLIKNIKYIFFMF